MSPKLCGLLWVFCLVTAGVMWLAGELNPVVIVAFGFVAFGLVFIGMMCVLPGAVSHPAPKRPKMPELEKAVSTGAARPAKSVSGFTTYGPA